MRISFFNLSAVFAAPFITLGLGTTLAPETTMMVMSAINGLAGLSAIAVLMAVTVVLATNQALRMALVGVGLFAIAGLGAYYDPQWAWAIFALLGAAVLWKAAAPAEPQPAT